MEPIPSWRDTEDRETLISEASWHARRQAVRIDRMSSRTPIIY